MTSTSISDNAGKAAKSFYIYAMDKYGRARFPQDASMERPSGLWLPPQPGSPERVDQAAWRAFYALAIQAGMLATYKTLREEGMAFEVNGVSYLAHRKSAASPFVITIPGEEVVYDEKKITQSGWTTPDCYRLPAVESELIFHVSRPV